MGTAVAINGTAIVEQVNGTAVLEQRDETRDEAIVAALVGGQTVRAVQKQFGLTIAQLDRALEAAFPLDTAARLRTIRGDLAWLDGIIQKFYLKALAGDGDADSAIVAVRAQERKSQLLGLDAVQRVDLQVVQVQQAESSRERMRKVIQDFIDRQPKVEREAINLMGKIGYERSLELLRAGGDVLPDPEPDPVPGPVPVPPNPPTKCGILG